MNHSGNQIGNETGHQTDVTVEKVLTGLRSAEVPAGMESRILQRLEARTLEARTAARPHSGWRNRVPARVWKPGLTRSWTTSIAASLALASLLVVIVSRQGTQRPQATPLQSHATTGPIPIQVAQSAPHAAIIANPPSLSAGAPARNVHRGNAESAAQPQPLSDEDALALSEMLAPSKPAPPLPITHQEELLAEAVHRADPEELANLSPDVRAREMEIAKAEFHNFFEPPSLNAPPLNPPPAKGNE